MVWSSGDSLNSFNLNTKGALPTFNVMAYEAVGNGSADDTVAITAAITAASVAGGIVYAPAGSYLVSQLDLLAKVRILGAGMGVTTFVKKGAATGDNIWTIKLSGNHAGIAKCTVKGASATSSGGVAVAITDSAQFCVIEDVEATLANVGILAGGLSNDATRQWDDCSYNTVRRCYVHNVNTTTISFYAPTIAYGNQGIGCLCTDLVDTTGGSGYELRNQDSSRYVGCYAEDLAWSYDIEEASTNCAIVGCQSKGASRGGMLVLGYTSSTGASGETRDSVISGFTSNGDHNGIYIQNADRIRVEGATIVSPGNHGVYLNGVSSGATSTDDDCVIEASVYNATNVGFYVEAGWGTRAVLKGKAVGCGSFGVQVKSTAGANGVIDVELYNNSSTMTYPSSWRVKSHRGQYVLLNGGGTTLTPDHSIAGHMRVRVTDNTNFTINGASAPTDEGLLIFEIENASGGAMGTITWNGVYRMVGGTAPTNPADTKVRHIAFRWDEASAVYREVWRSSNDMGV